MSQQEKSQKDVLDDWILKVDVLTRNRFYEYWQMQRIEYIINAYIIPFILEVFLCAVAIAFINHWISIRYSIQANLPWFMGIVGILIPRVANPPIPYMVQRRAYMDAVNYTTTEDAEQLLDIYTHSEQFLESIPANQREEYRLHIDILGRMFRLMRLQAVHDAAMVAKAIHERDSAKEKDHQ